MFTHRLKHCSFCLTKMTQLKISKPADVSYSIFYVKDALWKNVAAQPQHGKMIGMFTVNVQRCCFEMAAEVCSHQSVTFFKRTLLHQDGDKTVINQSVCHQFPIRVQANQVKSAICDK